MCYLCPARYSSCFLAKHQIEMSYFFIIQRDALMNVFFLFFFSLFLCRSCPLVPDPELTSCLGLACSLQPTSIQSDLSKRVHNTDFNLISQLFFLFFFCKGIILSSVSLSCFPVMNAEQHGVSQEKYRL